MKRKNPQKDYLNKQHKLVQGKSVSDDEYFLSSVKCHIFPANFGSGRLKILRNLINKYGGTAIETLPQTSDELCYIIFEESVNSDQLTVLIDQSKFTKTLYLSCTWLIECAKLKRKIATEPYEISVTKKFEVKLEPDRKSTNQETVEHHEPKLQDYEACFENAETCNSKLKLSVDQDLRKDSAKCFTGKDSIDLLIGGVSGSASCAGDSSKEDDVKYSRATIAADDTSYIEPKKVNIPEVMAPHDDASKSLIKPFPKYLQDKFACARPSSSKVKDLNSHITAELEKLATTYKSKNDTWRALGYQKAISAIRNYPREITTREGLIAMTLCIQNYGFPNLCMCKLQANKPCKKEALKIPGVGARLADKVAEIVESGRLRKVAEVCEGEEAETLKLFMGVWGAGPSTAQAWYTQGFKTLEDLRTKASLTRHQQIGLRLYHDLNTRIPRAEVVEIEAYVREAALDLVAGLVVEVCGSYRRGKATCGDVDVLITHPDGHSQENLFKQLLSHLRETGFLTDDLVCQEDNGNQQKYLGVCRLPGKDRMYRRLDIIVVPYSEFAPAIMYFTGSAHFNRSMRLLATKMGMSLSEHGLRVGIVRQGREKLTAGVLLDTPTEESIFTHLGLQYRLPQERDH